MTDAPHDEHDLLAQLIAAEKTVPDPPPEALQRVFGRLSASLALPPAPEVPADAGPATAPPAGPLARAVAGLSRRALVTFLAGAAVGAATYGSVAHLRRAPAVAPPAPPTLSAPVSDSVPAPSPTVPDLAPPPPPASASPAVAAPSRSSDRESPQAAARDRGLGAERKLIEMARTALARGQADSALGTLRRHAHAFPHGQLAEERDSLLVQALVAKGDYSQARLRAVRFHQQYPTSLFGPVVDQAVLSIP